MKIAFLSYYSGKIDRGVEVATEALATGLSKNHKVTIFQAGERKFFANTLQFDVEKNWPKDSSSSALRFLYLDYYSRKILLFTFKFLPFFFKEKYDVIIPTNGGWQVLLLRIITWIFGKKIIVQGNAGIGRDDLWQLICFPNYFIAISPQGFSWVKNKISWIKKIYIPHGVDNKLFNGAKPNNVLLKNPIVICVGAFLPYKQIDLLIRAMEKVSDASLLVIGQGPLEDELTQLGKKLLGTRFKLLTGITQKELPGYYKVARVFSLPSKSTEALGIVYIEAMASGIPIVAPDDDNRREIIGDAGVFVNPEDINMYAEGIKKALNKDFGKKPQEQAQKFDWEIIVQKYEKILVTL